MSGNYFKYLWALVFCVFFVSEQAQSQNMWGSGYYQGGIVCPHQTGVAKNAVSVTDDEKEARTHIKKLNVDLKVIQAEKVRAESETERLRAKVDKFFDSSVVEFILDVHVEGARKCSDYQSVKNGCLALAESEESATAEAAVKPEVDCDAKLEVPELLQKKWTDKDGGLGPYCVGHNRTSAGSLAPAICDDESLRPQEGRRSYNKTECVKALSDYRKNKILFANKADEEEEKMEEIRSKDTAISDARRRAEIDREYRLATETEAEDCPDGSCDAYDRGSSAPRLKRDWFSTTTNVVGGILNFAVGQQADRAGREEAAQYGVPSGGSYGYPYYQAGINGVINGLVGPGAYGCASTYGGGGFQNGLNGVNGYGNGMYGPAGANGGAFSYPQGMYASPWGGGAYNPGLNGNGGFNGPYGGTSPFGGQQFPGNGSMAMCFTWPCNTGGGGPQFGGQVGGQYGNPYGQGQYGNPYGQGQYGNPYGQGGQYGNPFGGPQFGLQIGGQYGNPYGQGQYGNPYGQGQLGMNGQLSMQYQMQMQQLQQQMQQQQMQAQMQYYQAQMQQQMQYQQVQQQRTQQAYQIQQQISQLNMQLQSLYYQNNYGGNGGLSLGGSINFGVGGSYTGGVGGIPMPGGFPSQNGGGYPPGYIPGYNTGTIPTNGDNSGGTRGR